MLKNRFLIEMKHVHRVVRHFENVAEEKPTEITLYGSNNACRMFRYWLTQESDDFNLLVGNGRRMNPLVELGKKLVGMSEHTMGALFALIDQTLPKENADKIKEITRKCDEELTVCRAIILMHSNRSIHKGRSPIHYRAFSATMAS